MTTAENSAVLSLHAILSSSTGGRGRNESKLLEWGKRGVALGCKVGVEYGSSRGYWPRRDRKLASLEKSAGSRTEKPTPQTNYIKQ